MEIQLENLQLCMFACTWKWVIMHAMFLWCGCSSSARQHVLLVLKILNMPQQERVSFSFPTVEFVSQAQKSCDGGEGDNYSHVTVHGVGSESHVWLKDVVKTASMDSNNTVSADGHLCVVQLQELSPVVKSNTKVQLLVQSFVLLYRS